MRALRWLRRKWMALKAGLLEVKLQYQPSCRPLVGYLGRLVGWSVCHNILKGREVTFPCHFRNTCFILCWNICNIYNLIFISAIIETIPVTILILICQTLILYHLQIYFESDFTSLIANTAAQDQAKNLLHVAVQILSNVLIDNNN